MAHPERRLLLLAGVRQESTLAATAGLDNPDGLRGGCAPAHNGRRRAPSSRQEQKIPLSALPLANQCPAAWQP